MKLSRIFSFIFLFAAFSTYAFDEESLENDPDFIWLQDDSLTEAISNSVMPAKAISPDAALAALIAANAPVILGCNLYLRTNPLNTRLITTLPTFLIFHSNFKDYCKFYRLYLFYNQTAMMLFTKKCPYIKSYLAIDNQNLLDVIMSSDLGIPSNLPDILSLFKNIKIEERKLGLMFQYLKNWNKTSFEIDIPFLYQERNFILTESEIADIKASNAFPSGSDNKVEESAIRKQVVADLIGFSDLKLKLGQQFVNDPCTIIIGGLELYVPTAFALKKGLVGSNFSNDTEQPTLNVTELIDLFVNGPTQEAIDFALDLLSKAADRLAAMTIQSELGDNKHFSLDAWAEGRFEFSDIFHINTYGNIKYTFPKKEIRYFLVKKDPCSPCFTNEKYEADLDSENQALIQCDLNFLEQEAINTLFPSALSTNVKPGFSAEFALTFHVTTQLWHIALGYDIWAKQHEKLTILDCNPGQFNLPIARAPQPYQSKIFGRLYKEISKKKFDFFVGLQGDYTIDSSGIGQDFTAAISFEFNF